MSPAASRKPRGFDFGEVTPPERESTPHPAVIEQPRSIASKHASKQAITIDDLFDDRPDPDADLVTVAVRIPRYLMNALKAHTSLARPRVSQQDVIKAALLGELPDNLVTQALAKAQRS